MQRSEQIGELVAALAKAQGEFTSVVKDNEAKIRGTSKGGKDYEYGYKYADLASVIAAVRPALSKHGIALVQLNSADLERQTAAVTTYLHCGEQFISESVEASAVGQTGFHVQSIGATWTYLRRYSLQSICGLASEDDDGASVATNSGPIQPKQQSSQQAPPAIQKAAQPAPPAPVGKFLLDPGTGILECVLVSVSDQATKNDDPKKIRPFVAVKFNGRIDGWDGASCWDKGLFDALHAGKGLECKIKVAPDSAKKFINVLDVLSVNGIEYFNGQPVPEGAALISRDDTQGE